jgi:hypothetical protein
MPYKTLTSQQLLDSSRCWQAHTDSIEQEQGILEDLDQADDVVGPACILVKAINEKAVFNVGGGQTRGKSFDCS